MKQITRYSIAIATLLLMSMGAWAAGGFTVNYQLDGESTTATVGEVTYSNGTITVTPADGYYLTAEDLKVIKTIDGQYGQTRTDPSIDATVAITATDANADPSGVTTYTFTVTDEKYDYEITANFHSRKDVAEALIALPEDAVFVYSGEAIEPAVSVTYAGEAMTADKDYTVEYANNINVGLGDVTITGIGIYKGTQTVNFDINQASVAIRLESADGSEAKELSSVYGTAFTEPILKLDPACAIEVKYSVDNEEIATVDAATGKLTILKTGTVVVTAAAKEDYTNKEGSNYNANPTNTKASYSLTITKGSATLKFSAKTATATMGTTFVAPTLTVTPEGLQGVKYSSSDANVAAVNETTGAVTLVAAGETTIKASFAGNDNYEAAEDSYTLTVSNATMNVTATGYEGVYDGNAHGITVTAPEGATVKYGTEEGKYDLTENPTYTNVGTYTVYYQVTKEATETVTGSAKVTINKVTATLKFSAETATATVGSTTFQAPTLTVTPGGLSIKYESTNTDVATVNETTGAVTLIGAGEATITATFAGNDKYEPAEASYKLTVSSKATMEVTATGYEGVYDGNAHGITVTAPEGATVKYGTEEGKYDLTENPTYTNVGTYTVYYQVTKEATETVTGSAKVTITKGSATLKFSAETATATMGTTFVAPTLTVTPEGLVPIEYESTNTEVATVDKNTGAVTLVAAGEVTIKAVFVGNENYEPAQTSYTLTVSEATPQTETVTLTFSEKTVSATLGEEFEAPTLTIEPEGLQGVKYTSSNTDVATVNETTGAVTLVAAGETTIKASFAGNDNYEAAEASYTLTVNRAQSEGYGLWINDIQVTEDNYFDVLGNSTDSKSGTIVFNPETNTLVMTNDVSNVEIESRLETLTLHINDVNKVKSIRFNNLGDATKTGKLAITTNGNFPGKVIITNDAGVSAISGFSELTLEQGLMIVEPELSELENGTLYKYDWDKTNPDNPVKDPATKAVCDAVTIGVVITPLTQNVTVLLTKGEDFVAKDANGNLILDTNGNPKPANLRNFALGDDILLTIWTEEDEKNSQAGQEVDAGYDDSGTPGITMVNTMTDAQVLAVATAVLTNTMQPGGTSFAYEFNGVTFIVPAGSGSIIIDQETEPDYEYHLTPVGLNETYNLVPGDAKIEKYEYLGGNRVKITIDYSNLKTQTYYMLYLTKKASSGARGGTRLGKRDKAHGKLYSVGVRPRSITEVNPPSEASGDVIDEEEDPKGVIDTPTPPTPPTGIQTVASESSANSGKWFTADGRQLDGKPTKPGFYIRNGKKIVIK